MPIRMPKWRNWQTRYVQGVVSLRSCGFESHLRHHITALQIIGGAVLTFAIKDIVVWPDSLSILAQSV